MRNFPAYSYSVPRTKAQNGFTLIELIIVLIIVGILAAVAIPSFIDMRREARIAAVNGLSAAINSAIQLSFAECITEMSTCGLQLWGGGIQPYVLVNGRYTYFNGGYPVQWPGGLDKWIDYSTSGFKLKPYVQNTPFMVFEMSAAPIPPQCKVTYEQQPYPSAPIVSTVTTGC